MNISKKRAAPIDDTETPAGARSAKKAKPDPRRDRRQNALQNAADGDRPKAQTSASNQLASVNEVDAMQVEERASGKQAERMEIPTASSSKAQPANTRPLPAPRNAMVVNSSGSRKQKAESSKKGDSKGHKIRKLVPRRPFPTVPTSMSATGPRSAHSEGKNYICITRKTPLSAYLRRCKELIIKDGYKSLHLHAMGAAITHLARLAVSLPAILPYPTDEIHTEIRTGTAEVHDEIIPDDEDEDISLRKRDKSTLAVVIKIGEGDKGESLHKKKEGKKKTIHEAEESSDMKKGRDQSRSVPEQIVFQEGDQDDDDMDS